MIGRSEIYYKGIQLKAIEHRFRNMTEFQKKQEHVLEHDIIETNEDGMPSKIYQRFKMPMMSQRDSVMKFKMDKLKGEHEGKIFFCMYTCDDNKYPPKKDVIRINMFQGFLFWADGNDSRALQFNTFNMGGYFPMRIMNMAMGSMLKKMMEKSYTDLKQIQDAESTGSTTE